MTLSITPTPYFALQVQPVALNSFDIFDTLLARRCVTSFEIYAEVERRCAWPGFVQLRIQAEQAAATQGEFTLDDVYVCLQRQSEQSEVLVQRAKALEIEVEHENAIPICENLEKLDDSSLLITDMCLPKPIIRSLLHSIGVSSHLNLLRSASGKYSGEMWRSLRAVGIRCSHLGDNPTSDLAQPLAYGMQAQQTRIAEPTYTEQVIAQAGCAGLARALRVARLSTTRGALELKLHRLQVELNLPMLVITSLFLYARLAAGDVKALLFSSRDARYLYQVFMACGKALGINTSELPAYYWYSSRLARIEGSDDYLNYCRDLVPKNSLMVDLCGTGRSNTVLRKRLGYDQDELPLFLCVRMSHLNTSKFQQRYDLDGIDVPQALWDEADFTRSIALEFLNYVPEGMALDVKQVMGGVVPLRSSLEFNTEQLQQVDAQATYVQKFCKCLEKEMNISIQREVATHLDQLRREFSVAAHTLGGEVGELLNAWIPNHLAQERALIPDRVR